MIHEPTENDHRPAHQLSPVLLILGAWIAGTLMFEITAIDQVIDHEDRDPQHSRMVDRQLYSPIQRLAAKTDHRVTSIDRTDWNPHRSAAKRSLRGEHDLAAER